MARQPHIPQPQPNVRPLRYPTSQKESVLEALIEYEVLTVKDLAGVIYNRLDKVALSSIVRTTRILEQQGLVNRTFFQPDVYEKKPGLLPYACGLSIEGVEWAHANIPASQPKEFAKHLSPLMLPHTLAVSRFHLQLAKYCDENDLRLYWRKIDLNHTVEPDALFAIEAKGKTTYYFYERERHRKTHKKLHDKFARYESYYGTDKCKQEWIDFRTFVVITQMRTEESRRNILNFLSGQPAIWNGKRFVNDQPIKRSNFWFSTEQDPFSFQTPKDSGKVEYSLLN
jgi:Replication-relaxation